MPELANHRLWLSARACKPWTLAQCPSLQTLDFATGKECSDTKLESSQDPSAGRPSLSHIIIIIRPSPPPLPPYTRTYIFLLLAIDPAQPSEILDDKEINPSCKTHRNVLCIDFFLSGLRRSAIFSNSASVTSCIVLLSTAHLITPYRLSCKFVVPSSLRTIKSWMVSLKPLALSGSISTATALAKPSGHTRVQGRKRKKCSISQRHVGSLFTLPMLGPRERYRKVADKSRVCIQVHRG